MAELTYVLKKYYVVVAMILLFLCSTYVNAKGCVTDDDCPIGKCCSRFGYCGSGPGYCD